MDNEERIRCGAIFGTTPGRYFRQPQPRSRTIKAQP
jgi:hypothetical protein